MPPLQTANREDHHRPDEQHYADRGMTTIASFLGHFPPVLSFIHLMLLIGHISSVKRRELLLLIHNSSSKTAQKPRKMLVLHYQGEVFIQ
jgi:hypothetical protein